MTQTKKINLLLLFIVLGSYADAWQESESSSVISIDKLQIIKSIHCEIDSGSVTIRGTDKDFLCKYRAHNIDPKASVSVELVENELLVIFKKDRKNEFKKSIGRAKRKIKHFFERIIFGDVCPEVGIEMYNAHVDFELYVPHNVFVEVALGSGLINIDDVDNAIYIDAGSACVRAHNIASHLYLHMGQGQEVDLSYKDVSFAEPKICELKGASIDATIDIPSRFCVKNTLTGSLYATRVRNKFNPCREHPDIWVTGHVSSGTIDIIQR